MGNGNKETELSMSGKVDSNEFEITSSSKTLNAHISVRLERPDSL